MDGAASSLVQEGKLVPLRQQRALIPMAETASNALSLPVLNEQRVETKALIKEHQKALLDIEKQILGHADLVPLKEKGTTHQGDFKIVTAESRSWNQEILSSLYHERVNAGLDVSAWPFKTEWKEDKVLMQALHHTDPEYAAAIELAALTTKPSKPSFSDVDKKG